MVVRFYMLRALASYGCKRHTSLLNKANVTTGLRHGSTKSKETPAVNALRRCVQTTGPLTVAEYMREALTNPVTGYYMNKDVFGTKGDFITSPEISQMFGELIALWVLHEWSQLEQKGALQIVELGPGRGTLSDDMLRVFKQFEHLTGDGLSLHLVEVSPKMSQLQEEKLTGKCAPPSSSPPSSTSSSSPSSSSPSSSSPLSLSPLSSSEDTRDTHQPDSQDSGSGGHGHLPGSEATSSPAYKTVTSKTGIPVSWYRSLKDVPQGMSCYIAHEFFDALPIHKFQKTEKGWREVLVDIDGSETGPHHFRFVLSPAPTPASTVYPQLNDSRDAMEVCPEGGVLVEEIAKRISVHGGMSLIVDYGHDGTKTDTLRGFKNHKLHDALCEPGTADLTADVDFSYFRHVVQDRVSTHGPVSQEKFLKAMGIETRLKMLLRGATSEQCKDLISGYRMLTDPAQMGDRFKFFAMQPRHRTPDNSQPRCPAGFL